MLILYEYLNLKIKTLLKIYLFTLPQLVEEFQHVLKLLPVYDYYILIVKQPNYLKITMT